jgi:hypothetical protein
MKSGARKSWKSSIDLRPMKASFATAALILAAAACLGWRDHQELTASRAKNTELLAEAAALGITPDPKHPREKVFVNPQRDARLKLTPAEYIAFVKEMAAEEKRLRGKEPSREVMNRYEVFMERLAPLDVGDLTRLVTELRSTSELDDELRSGALFMALSALSNRYPQAALTLLTEFDVPQGITRQHLAGVALSNWAKSDPVAAVKWVNENAARAPELTDDRLKRGLLASAAAQDPKLAFQLLGDLKFKDGNNAVASIVNAAKTPAERTSTLQALREYAANLKESREREASLATGLSSLADSVAKDGFQQGVQWIDSAKLSATELQGLGKNISAHNIPTSDIGQWVEWLGNHLPSDTTSNQISTMLDSWTQKDYVAAGKWLTATPDGPTKQAAVIGYVQAVASYEPETAAQWAMTLSSGEDRARALRQVYHHWLKKDPAAKAAAEAFADQHGIKR